MEKINNVIEQIFEDIFKRNPHLLEEKEEIMNIVRNKGKQNERNKN